MITVELRKIVPRFLFIVLICLSAQAKADHIMGSDITYKCSKGNDSIFTIIINFYRDCRGCYVLSQSPKCGTSEDCNSSGTVPTQLTLTCTSGGGSLGTVSMKRVSITDITKTCRKEISKCEQPCNGTYPYGIEKHTFEGTIDLRGPMKSGCCRFRVSTANICCRSVNITTGPSGGFYTYLEIDACKKPCNTSPQLTNDPVAILCCNQPYFFNNGAVDTVNYDSLSYSLASAWASQSSKSNYTGGYSGAFPIKPYFPSNWSDQTKSNPNVNPPIGIYMDPVTGDLIFTPTECGQEAVVVMQIDEWRKNSKGVYENIGVTRRDMHFIVQICPDNNPPKITNTTYKYSVCAESEICFDITTKDDPFIPPPPAKTPSPDTVTLSWNRGIPGATFTIKNPKAREQIGTFCWKPNRNQASDLPYTFTATARDNACPKNALTTRSFAVYVKPLAETKRVVTPLICGKYAIESQIFGGFKTPATYFWEVSDSTNQPLTKKHYTFKSTKNVVSNKEKDTIHFRRGGKYIIHHRINNAVNCPSDYFDTLIVPPLLEVDLALGPDTFVCYGSKLRLAAKVTHGVPAFSYKWFTPINFDAKDTLDYIDLVMDNTTDSTFRVEISDKNKCTAFDTINVFLKKNPVVNMGPDIRICWYDSILIAPVAKNAIWVNPETGDTLIQGDTLFWKWKYNGTDYSTQATSKIAMKGIYSVSVIDSLGCSSADTMRLLVNDTIRPNAGLDQVKCFDDFLTLKASGLDTAKKYQTGSYNWWKGILELGPPFSKLQNPKFQVQNTDCYLLKVIIKEDTLSCYNYDTVCVKVNPLPAITVVGPQKYCCDYGNIALGSSVFGSPVGGTWSCRQNASFISGSSFLTPLACNPVKASNYILIYTYTDPSTTCVKYDSTVFTINPLPSIKLNGGTICQNAKRVPLKPYIKAPQNINAMVDVKFKMLRTLPKTGGGTVTAGEVFPDFDPSLNYDFWIVVKDSLIDLLGKNSDSMVVEIEIQDGQGCFNKDTAVYYIIGTPIIKFSGFPPLCIDVGIVNLSSISKTTPLTGKWIVVDSSATKPKDLLQIGLDNNNGDTLNTSKLNIQNAPGMYKMRYFDISTGCYIKRDTVLIINPLPNVTISLSPSGDKGKFCQIDPDVTLNASPAGGTWSSTVPGIIGGGVFMPKSVGAADRDQWIKLTYSYTHPTTKCDTTKSLQVFVQSKPTVSILTPDMEVCRTNTMNFTLNADYKFTSKITWYHDADVLRANFENNNQSSSNNPCNFTVRPRSDSATVISLACITEAEGVCPFDQDFLNLRINPVPHAQYTLDDPDGCVPHTIQVSCNVTNGVDPLNCRYTWQFADGDSLVGNTGSHTYQKPGLYTGNLKIRSEKSCDTIIAMPAVDVYPLPVADFEPNPNNRTTKALPRFRFNNLSRVIMQNKITRYAWDFGDLNVLTDTSSLTNPEYYYTGDTGTYYVSLLAETEHQCTDQIIKPVVIEPDILVYIPNVFTPEGAGPVSNERFKIVASGVKTFQVLVFNRWGEKLFESDNLDISWDGNYLGEKVQMDAYIYQVNVTSYSGRLYKYSGTVILAR